MHYCSKSTLPQVSRYEALRYWLMIDCMKPLKLASHSNNLKLVTWLKTLLTEKVGKKMFSGPKPQKQL